MQKIQFLSYLNNLLWNYKNILVKGILSKNLEEFVNNNMIDNYFNL